jgi:modulator of FtsH protease HflK
MIKNFFQVIKKYFGAVLCIVFLAVAASQVPYKVDTDEIGKVYTLGIKTGEAQSGMNFKIPFIQKVKKAKNPNAITPLLIGYRDIGGQQYQTIPEEAKIITGDGAIVDVEWVIELQVLDGDKSIHNSEDPQEVIRDIALKNMRQVINTVTLDFATTIGKEQIASLVGKGIDSDLKSLDIGYNVKKLQIQDLQPPEEIVAAFKLVNDAKLKNSEAMSAAKSDEAKEVNQAKAEVAKVKADAEAEKDRIISQAKGETADFFSLYELYKINKEATKRQMLTDVLGKLLPKAKVYITDGNTVNYLNLEGLKPQTQSQSKSEQ